MCDRLSKSSAFSTICILKMELNDFGVSLGNLTENRLCTIRRTVIYNDQLALHSCGQSGLDNLVDQLRHKVTFIINWNKYAKPSKLDRFSHTWYLGRHWHPLAEWVVE